MNKLKAIFEVDSTCILHYDYILYAEAAPLSQIDAAVKYWSSENIKHLGENFNHW